MFRHTEESKRLISLNNTRHFLGKKHTLESRKKMSESHKGQASWNKGTKGIMNPNETSFKKGVSPWNKGKEMSEDYKVNCSLAQTGKEVFDGFYKSKNTRLRRRSKYKAWRESIFKRDDYTCQDCGVRGDYLHAHHKIPLKEVLKERKNGLLFDTNNGITLCKRCHFKIHSGGTK